VNFDHQSVTQGTLVRLSNVAERPDTLAFKTRDGDVGLLQFKSTDKEAGKLTIRYRLERRDISGDPLVVLVP
jgi:hypothetical protein